MQPQSGATTTGGRYYGWVVAWTAFAVLTLAYGVQYCFGVFLPFIQEDLGITRTQGTLAFAVYVFFYSALSALSGWLTDRKGPRFVLVLGALFLGVGYLLTAMAQTALQLVLALGLVASIGMSAAFVPCNATVVRWLRSLPASAHRSGSDDIAALRRAPTSEIEPLPHPPCRLGPLLSASQSAVPLSFSPSARAMSIPPRAP